jgi:hypothetical protein
LWFTALGNQFHEITLVFDEPIPMGIAIFNPSNDASVFSEVGSKNSYRSGKEQLQVIIIGGGPSGLFQAYLLARLGGKLFLN